MVKVLVEDSSLSSIGDSIRAAKGEDKYLHLIFENTLTITNTNSYYIKLNGLNKDNYTQFKSWEHTVECGSGDRWTSGWVVYYDGTYNAYTNNGNGYKTGPLNEKFTTVSGWNNSGEGHSECGIYYKCDSASPENPYTIHYRIETSILLDEQDPATNYLPSEMAGEIDKLSELTVPLDMLNLTGNCEYRFAYSGMNSFIEKFGGKINSKDITSASSMFYSNTNIRKIPFELNGRTGTNVTCGSMFNSCNNLVELPKLKNWSLGTANGMFNNLFRLREIPEDYFYDEMFARAHSYPSFSWSSFMSQCYSLRKIPDSLIRNMYTGNPGSYSYSNMNSNFSNMYVLDELMNFPVNKNTSNWTSNIANNFLSNSYRLRRFTFETNDGVPYTWKARGTTINLSTAGYVSSTNINAIIGYNSGLSRSKFVGYSATGTLLTTLEAVQARYEEIKYDPDYTGVAATTSVSYKGVNKPLYVLFSRYNHNSAVETINSLPDTSSVGTNTITFKNYAGACTDGGGINDLTQEEIAVAAAKGWTVSLVN